MKRLFLVLSLLTLGGWAQAVTNGAVAISSGTAYYTVDVSSVGSNGNARQNIVIADPSLTSGLAPVSSVTGLTVNLASSTANVGTVMNSVLVSSNTVLPTSVADTGQAQAMGDNKGRLITQPLTPWGMVFTATATLTTSTAETIFISSGGAGVSNTLIGCIGENTSTTVADITFRQGLALNAGSFKLGMSASNVPTGFFPPGGIPQSKTNLNSNWTIQGSASVTSLAITCWYYPYTP